MKTYPAWIVALALPGVAVAQPGGAAPPVYTAGTDAAQSPAGPAAPQADGAGPPGPPSPNFDPAANPTRAMFASSSDQPWDVWIDRQAICATPCTLGLAGLQYVVLKTQERSPVRLDVGYLPAGDVVVTATHLREGMYAGGIVATTFAGMALTTGITLTAVSLGVDSQGMRTAGLITGIAGAIGLAGGISLMRAALPRFTIAGAQPYVSGGQAGLTGRF